MRLRQERELQGIKLLMPSHKFKNIIEKQNVSDFYSFRCLMNCTSLVLHVFSKQFRSALLSHLQDGWPQANPYDETEVLQGAFSTYIPINIYAVE